MSAKKLEYINLRHSWLDENIKYLTDHVDCGLSVLDSEREIGFFNVDVFCEDEYGNSAFSRLSQEELASEEQLGHILSYAVGASPKTVIWLSPSPGEKHVNLLKWLDEISPDEVRWYLFKIEAIKVHNSPPVPFFTLVFSPNQERLCSEDSELAERYRKRVKFWEGLLTILNEKTKLYMSISLQKDHLEGIKIKGTYYQLIVSMENGSIQMVQCY